MNENQSESKLFKLIRVAKTLVENGKLPQEYFDSAEYKQAVFQAGIDDGMLKVGDDGAGFKVRTKASFSDTDAGYEDALMDHFGEGKVGSYVKDGEKQYVYMGEDGEWDHVDPDTLEWADVADTVGYAPEVIAGTVGGTAGLLGGGVPGAVAGGSLGTVLGRAGKKKIGSLLGIDNEQAAVDELGDLGESALYGGVGEGVGQLGSKAIAKIANPFKHQYGLEQDRLEKIALDAGVRLTPADTMGVNSLTRLENLLGYGFTGDSITNFKDMQFKGLKDYLLKNIEAKTGGLGAKELGESVQQKTVNMMQHTKDNFSKRYDALAEQAGTVKMPMWEAQRKANALLEEVNLLPDAYIDQDVKKKLTAIAELGKKEGTDPELTYPAYKAVRSELGDMSKSNVAGGDAKAGKFKTLKGSLDTDFENAMQGMGLGGEKKALDGDYMRFKQDISRPEIKNVVGTDRKAPIYPEKVIDTMVTPRGTTRLDNAIKMSGAKGDLEKGHLANMIDRSTVKSPNGDEYISAAKLGTYQRKYGDVHNNLVGKDTQDVLNNYINLDQAVGASTPNRVNPSGTAKAIEGAIDAAVVYGAGSQGLLLPASKFAAAKYYTSPTGYKHLTKGLLDDNQVQFMQKTLGNIGVASAPAIGNQ